MPEPHVRMMTDTAPRLLSINSYHYHRGGADNVYFQHAALMEGLGWRNAFFAMHYPKNLATDWSRFFVDEIQFGHHYSLAEKVVKATKVVWSFEAQRQLRRLLAEFRPDVAHLHNIYHHLSPSILPVLRKAGVPTVLTAHDLKIACPNNRMYNATGVCERCKGGRVHNVVRFRCVQDSLAASAIVAAEAVVNGVRRTYRDNVDRIVVPSRFFLEKFVEWGWPRNLFRYIPNWLDATRVEADPRPGGYFLYLGRLAPEKGVATLIRAARQAGVRLAVAGDGPMRQALEGIAEGATDRIELLGFRSGDELARIVRGARAVVAPSEWYENAPLSVLEALAAGKPLIGSRIGGIPELIDEGRTGWLFPAGDVDVLAALLGKVAAIPDATLAAMGREGRARVERDFNRQGYVEAMLALYADIGVRMPQPTPPASTDRRTASPGPGGRVTTFS
jgi:glycosyltransferase involved in cell wall biosynthesis